MSDSSGCFNLILITAFISDDSVCFWSQRSCVFKVCAFLVTTFMSDGSGCFW